MDSNPWQVERLWPDSVAGPLRLRIAFGEVDGRQAVTAVELRGVEPAHPWPTTFLAVSDAAVRAADIRLPLGAMLDEWIALQASRARASRALFGAVPGHEETVQSFERRSGIKRPGRPRTPEAFLRQVAEVYETAVQNGDRAPAVRVHAELEARTLATARGWVRQARKRGFLPPVKRS